MQHLQIDRVARGPVQLPHERKPRRCQPRLLTAEHSVVRHGHSETGGIADVGVVTLQTERIGVKPVGLPQARMPLQQGRQQGRIAPAQQREIFGQSGDRIHAITRQTLFTRHAVHTGGALRHDIQHLRQDLVRTGFAKNLGEHHS